MAIGMYANEDPYMDGKRESKEADQVQIGKYRRHVEAGTVPPEGQIPYTRTGVEKYRHSCVADEFKPGAKPVLPLYTTRNLPIIRVIPTGCTTTQEYIKKFNSLNHYKET